MISKLMIGSWVMYSDRQLKVVGVELHTNLVTLDWLGNTTVQGDKIKPIPLSPEILERCGFEKQWLDDDNHEEGCYYDLSIGDELEMSLISGDKNGYMEVCLFPFEGKFRYRYLHELQLLTTALGVDMNVEI